MTRQRYGICRESGDMLTELYNLKHIHRLRIRKKIKERWACAGPEHECALVNLDVNNFAYVNENYGQVGDSILQGLQR